MDCPFFSDQYPFNSTLIGACDIVGQPVLAQNLARHLDIDPEAALRRTNGKFRRRFAYIEKNIEKRCGKPLSEADLDEMEALWQEAKTEAP